MLDDHLCSRQRCQGYAEARRILHLTRTAISGVTDDAIALGACMRGETRHAVIVAVTDCTFGLYDVARVLCQHVLYSMATVASCPAYVVGVLRHVMQLPHCGMLLHRADITSAGRKAAQTLVCNGFPHKYCQY